MPSVPTTEAEAPHPGPAILGGAVLWIAATAWFIFGISTVVCAWSALVSCVDGVFMVVALVLGALTGAPCALYTAYQLGQLGRTCRRRCCADAPSAAFSPASPAAPPGTLPLIAGARNAPAATDCSVDCRRCPRIMLALIAVNIVIVVVGLAAYAGAARSPPHAGDACHAALRQHHVRIAAIISIAIAVSAPIVHCAVDAIMAGGGLRGARGAR